MDLQSAGQRDGVDAVASDRIPVCPVVCHRQRNPFRLVDGILQGDVLPWVNCLILQNSALGAGRTGDLCSNFHCLPRLRL